jgi:spermidine synthase
VTTQEQSLPDKPPIVTILHDSSTALGHLTLRKRYSAALERDVFEMTVQGELMMSSAIAVSEQALAEYALRMVAAPSLRVLIGGLGFGFTALAAMADERVRDITVVERLAPVIDWHRNDMFPWSSGLLREPRLRVVLDDFFEFADRAAESPVRHDCVLIDIDDSPDRVWHASHKRIYDATGLRVLKSLLRPSGVLALWCATHPGEEFLEVMSAHFATVNLEAVHFENPCLRQPEVNYIVLARPS